MKQNRQYRSARQAVVTGLANGLRCAPLMLVLTAAVGAGGTTAAPTPTSDERDMFRAEVRGFAEMLRIPGFSLVVVKDGRIVCRQMEGYANLEKRVPLSDDSLFQIASITKTFTANLMMQYEEAHLASLDDPALNYRFINTYFGWPYDIDPDAKVRHFLSHTSEDGPGRSFIYNGQRFNYIWGVFEAVGRHPPGSEAYSLEVKERVFRPLRMNESLTGFPKSRNDPAFARIATPYIYDKNLGKFVEDVANYKWTQAYPATGIMSTIGDMLKYNASYDAESLISRQSYAKLTSPTVLTDGSFSPYGIGWFSEEFGSRQVHWAYGHSDSYASLLIRVPAAGYAFVFLSNSNAASDALRLGSGRIWQSPFAALFLKRFVFADVAADSAIARRLDLELNVGRALFSHYASKLYGTADEAPEIVDTIFQKSPARFDEYDPALTSLASDLSGPKIAGMVRRLAAGYRSNRHLQPYVATDLARYYDRTGERESAFGFSRQLADSAVMETWDIGIDACLHCGEYLFERGETALARKYFWRAVNRMKSAGADDKIIQLTIDKMNRLSAVAAKAVEP